MKRASAVVFLAAFLFPAVLQAYDCYGPHQAINRLAMEIFLKSCEKNPAFRNYRFTGAPALRKLRGESVIASGDLYEWDRQTLLADLPAALHSAGLFWVPQVFKKMTAGDKSLSLAEWIEEGGYTADEPEFWQALRHFYDPLVPDPKKRYLSDWADWGLYLGKKVGDVLLEMPEIDAVEWAVEGPPFKDFHPNPYAWNRGVDFMRRAFFNAESPEEKDRLFAAAWRALGETMHLLADMTVPEHVRNDSHPGAVPAGSLKGSPYERFLIAETIRDSIFASVKDSAGLKPLDFDGLRAWIDGALAGKIDGLANLSGPVPEQNVRRIFHETALYTNAHFFSQDTFSGTLNGKAIAPANKMPAYPSPKLEDCVREGEWFVKDGFPNGTKVFMARESLLSTSGWEVDRRVAISQGQVLVPLAVYACARLMDAFVPRITVEIAVNPGDKKLTGKIVPAEGGAFGKGKPLLYNKPKNWPGFVELYVDGKKQDPLFYSIEIKDNAITGDLSRLSGFSDFAGHKVELEVDLGGWGVRSAPAAMAGAPSFRLVGSFITGPTIFSRAILPRDLGKMTNANVAWRDYQRARVETVMTATGEAKGLIYLYETLNREDDQYVWSYALILPRDIKPGTYEAAINFYQDLKGPMTVPVTLKIDGEASGAAAKLDSNASLYLTYLLNDLKSDIEAVTRKFEEAKRFDHQKAVEDNARLKLKKGESLKADIETQRRRMEAFQQSLDETRQAIAKTGDPTGALKSQLDSDEGRIEEARKKIERSNELLSTLEETYRNRENEIVREHKEKLVNLERIKGELTDWEAAVRKAHGL